MRTRHEPWGAVAIAGVLFLASLAGAAEPLRVQLWPNAAPGAKGDQPEDRPALFVYLPAPRRASGTAVIVCPGGGYGMLAISYEGHDIARWFNTLGVAAFVLDYRHRGKGYGHPAPLLDAQRAVRLVRARAAEWQIAADRVGILGFSAGGHLASTAATHFDRGTPGAEDPVDRESCRPDFAILCYAVIAFSQPFGHRGSLRNLLGEDPDPELVVKLSSEKQVTRRTPPCFLWTTWEDKVVPAANSIAFYQALQKAGVPAELHIFERGRHGLGLAAGTPGTEHWPVLCQAWLQNRRLLPKPPVDAP
jgi:acetyl esterase/lipase